VNDRLSIGECARRAGLSVSALRFYGDRGLLPPASVDPDTGYRAYGEHEVAVAVTIRDLRRLGMPLTGVAAYLGAAPARRQALLDAHLAGLEHRLRDARAVAHGLRPSTEECPMSMTVPAPAFAAALDQVLPAAGSDPERPVLWCVLVEAREGSLRLVATDAHRLAVRDLVPAGPGGGAVRGLVPAATLRRWRADLPGRGELTVGVEGPDVVVRGDGLERRARHVVAEFPDYEPILSAERRAQVVVAERAGLLAACDRLTAAGAGAVLLHARPGGLTLIREREREDLAARYDGPDLYVALDPAYAADALRAAVGPDVVIEITDPLAHVVVRSADDGTATTLLMPVRLD
jgi:DNA polymerase III sliding clamp (beta) subunit (PCNA family)